MDQFRVGLSEREEKQLRALHRRKEREAEGRFLAEGIRVVEDLLASPLGSEWALLSSSLEDNERGARLVGELERRGIPRRVVDARHFDRLAATENSQGVIVVAGIPAGGWDSIATAPDSVVLLLDAVQDPGNFGTMVRTAEALGAAGLVALTGTVDPWNPKSIRSAAGSSFRLPIVSASWTEAATWLRGRGYSLLVAEAGGPPVRPGGGRVGLVVGNEGAGVAPEIRAGVDGTVGIPLRGRAESLNVAAAAAILLYELTR